MRPCDNHARTLITTPFRFRDLAPELRNRIYDCVFEDEAPHRMSLLDIRAAAPPIAITAVSKQVRNESLGLYKLAVAAFDTSHDYYVSIDNGDYKPKGMELFTPQRVKLPWLVLQRLEFVITGLKDVIGYQTLLLDFHALAIFQRPGKVKWTWW